LLRFETELKKTKHVTQVKIKPGKDTQVNLYTNFGPKHQRRPMRVATVDLRVLGKEWKKVRHQIHHVYVLGGNSEMPSIEETIDPIDD
jgi:hypothetical protein